MKNIALFDTYFFQSIDHVGLRHRCWISECQVCPELHSVSFSGTRKIFHDFDFRLIIRRTRDLDFEVF